MSRARDVANFIPDDGGTGDALVKASSTPYDMIWAPAGGGGLPPIVPGDDQGKALVINELNQPEWGAVVDSPDQTIDGGDDTSTTPFTNR